MTRTDRLNWLHREQGKKMGRSRVESDIRASTDARLVKAAGDNGYHLTRSEALGVAALVELLAGGDPC